MDRQQARQCLSGYIPSIRTPFNRDGSIDFNSLRNIVEFCIDAGCKVIMLTAGDSHYICLSDQEIAEVTKVVCEQVAGRRPVVAADRYYSTDRAIDFAHFVRELGVDILMCLPPDWANSCTAQTLAEHYAAVARHIPVMIVTNIFIPRGQQFGLETINLALDLSERIVAIKDDFGGDFARRLCLAAYGRCALFSGGRKESHLNMWPYGVDGYLSTFITFKPEIAHRYWQAVQTGQIEQAGKIAREIDMPFMDHLFTYPGSFNAVVHGVYELFGLAHRWRRKPYYSLNDQEMERLADFLKSKSLL